MADDSQFEALYALYFELLVNIAIFKFHVPDPDAEGLAHDVLLGYVRKPTGEIRALRSWLIGAICHASRHFKRQARNNANVELSATFDRVDPSTANIVDSLPDQLAAREALAGLSPRYQMILRMRYFEGYSVAELAQHLGVKTKYCQKLITKCLRRAEQLYTKKGLGRKAETPKAPPKRVPKKKLSGGKDAADE